MSPDQKQQIREKLADIEHQRWAKWQAYLHSKLYPLGESDLSLNNHLLVMPTELYQKWERQIATPYPELSEKEKDSDRNQVDIYLPIIEELVDLAIKQTEEQIVEAIREYAEPYEEARWLNNVDAEKIITLIRNK